MFEHNSTFHFNNSLIYKETIFKSKDYTYLMYLRMWDKIRTKGYEACSASLVTELFLLTAGLCCFGYTVYDIELEKKFPEIEAFLKIGSSSEDFSFGKKLNCMIFGFGQKIAVGSGYMMTNDIVYGREACQLPNSVALNESFGDRNNQLFYTFLSPHRKWLDNIIEPKKSEGEEEEETEFWEFA